MFTRAIALYAIQHRLLLSHHQPEWTFASKMSQPPDLGTLRLDDDSDQEDIFDGMDEAEETITMPNANPSLSQQTPSRHDRQESQDARDAALRKELESVKAVNKVIEGVIASLEKAKGNMNVRGNRLSYHNSHTKIYFRLSIPQFNLHQHCSTPGPEFFLRPSTTSA